MHFYINLHTNSQIQNKKTQQTITFQFFFKILFVENYNYLHTQAHQKLMIENLSVIQKSATDSRIASSKAVTDQNNIISIIDKSLKHLNQISEANFIAQDLYIELLKEKKTMKFDQIKKIYFTLTEGKAKQVLFEKDKKELISTDYQNHQGLVRLCWRSIQKLIKKIAYYMINQNHLSVISKNVLKLIQLNQKFVRRFHKLKNSSMLLIVEIIERLIEENSILEKKIYDILLNRGYVVSLDQFYKLNGYGAQHRDAYYAKQEEVTLTQSEDEQEPADKQKSEIKPSSKNSKNPTIRKKKGFRIDFRYSWREKVQIQQKEEQKGPVNKTNYQIRQSFEKFIGDFLDNDNLNQVLDNYQFQDENIKKNDKQTPRLNQVSVMQKKIFQNKIEAVINNLKGNSIKVSSKLLEIIKNSSGQAINSKVNYGPKKFADRKKGQGQKKFQDSQTLNDRKIVNESFFRELLKRNTKIQNYVNQEILKDTKNLKNELEKFRYQSPKVNGNAILLNKKGHNQNNDEGNLNKLQRQKLSQEKPNKMLVFKPLIKMKDQSLSINTIKSTIKLIEAELNCKYQAESRKIIEGKQKNSVAHKIKIAREGWELKNQKTILEAIQNSAIDPANLIKFSKVFEGLNIDVQPLAQKIKEEQQKSRENIFSRQKLMRLRTVQTELGSELIINSISNQGLNEIKNQADANDLKFKRTKTEIYPSQFCRTQTLGKKTMFENMKENHRPFEIFDRRLRRFLRR